MATANKVEYVPGVCNIGDTEIANRRKTANTSAVITIIIWVGLIALNVPVFTFIIVAFPAFVAATAYIQSKQRFCAGFGAEGLYNFGDELGKTTKAPNAEDRVKDKKKAVNITIRAAVIGVLTAALAGACNYLFN